MHAAIAAGSRLATDAGAAVIAAGGNAVDACMAASLVTLISEPGIVALGAGGFVTVWGPEAPPCTIDGYVTAPGLGGTSGTNQWDVHVEYGGGVTTGVGPASIGAPGAPAALELAVERYGAIPWRDVVAPAIEVAKRGFPLSPAAHTYLEYTHEAVFGWHPASREVLHDADGKLLPLGSAIRIPGLAESLEQMAVEGTEAFYRGELARRIVEEVRESGGALTAADLAGYRPVEREPLDATIAGWDIVTNPPPAVGGVSLLSMLHLMDEEPVGGWDKEAIERLIAVQTAVLTYRRDHLDPARERTEVALRLLDEVRDLGLDWLARSPSTIHTSVVDEEGLACSATFSAGYGSGMMPGGTGIWMNNSLGEKELNERVPRPRPGERLLSNMAPTVARDGEGRVVAIGSPGADRITTAILQVFLNTAHLNLPLAAAIAHPRLHVDIGHNPPVVVHEPGLHIEGHPVRTYERLDMYFGGVNAAALHPDGVLEGGADPRRSGDARVL